MRRDFSMGVRRREAVLLAAVGLVVAWSGTSVLHAVEAPLELQWHQLVPPAPPKPPKSFLAHSFRRQGDLVEKTLKVFHIETVLNNRAFDGPLSFLTKNEDDFTEADRLKYQAMKWTLDKLPFAARREIFMRTPAAYELIGCYAGACEPTHAKTLAKQNEQNCVEVDGPADILVYGIPYISPYNVNSKALNPLLVQVMALGYFYHMYRNQPILRDGGVLILTHPCSDKFDPVHHPSYIEFFNRILTETTDS